MHVFYILLFCTCSTQLSIFDMKGCTHNSLSRSVPKMQLHVAGGGGGGGGGGGQATNQPSKSTLVLSNHLRTTLHRLMVSANKIKLK